jgi:hypothetical protein
MAAFTWAAGSSPTQQVRHSGLPVVIDIGIAIEKNQNEASMRTRGQQSTGSGLAAEKEMGLKQLPAVIAFRDSRRLFGKAWVGTQKHSPLNSTSIS